MQHRLSKISIPLNDSNSLVLVRCPAGKFQMGAGELEQMPDELPQHEVRIERAFWIAQTPITRGQFSAVIDRKYPRVLEDSINCPAAQHTWLEAVEFCQKLEGKLQGKWGDFGLDPHLNYQINLPTEQQWEYACRAGTTTKWFFGDDEKQLERYAWYGRYDDFSPIPQVMQKLPNPWGLYDVYGLVVEWCLNEFYRYEDSADPPVTPITESNYGFIFKIIRGGNAYSHYWHCRSAARNELEHWNSQNDLTGFRIVLIEV
jgi:formylglycine-generating enzyme required for sulfatase activity